MKKIFILILLIIDLFGNTIEIAKDLFDKKEKYKEAIEIFQKFEDDAEAQYYLGKAYLYGMGIDKDSKKAFEYAKKSADKNNSSGLNLLGAIYDYGEGVNKDEAKAFKYYEEAAKLGNTKAMINLAKVINLEEAKKWLIKAHELGDLNGTINLAFFLSSTEIKNYKEAIIYYDIYMKSGYKMTSNIYYRMASSYEGIEKYKRAYEFYVKSIELGEKGNILSIIYSEGIRNIISDDEYLYWLKKGVELKLDTAYLPLFIYYQEKKDYKNLKLFLEKAYYEDKNLDMGCKLSSYFLNLINENPENADLEKAYSISTEIISENSKSQYLNTCYSTLSYMYARGNYLSIDLKKAIEMRQRSLENSNISKETDLEFINEYTLKLNNDLELLKKIDINDKRIYSILDNFVKKEQVNGVLETKKYFFFSVNDKSIKMYDKKNLKILKEFRPWISKGLEGNPLQMAFDENKNILYFSVYNSINDMSKNDLIHGIDIKNGKIIKTLKNRNAIKNGYLEVSSDGKYIVAINNNNLINVIDTENNKIQHYNFGNPVVFLAANIIKENNDYIVNIVSNDKKLYKFSLKLARNTSVEDFNNQINFRTFNGNLALKIFDDKNSVEIENITMASKNNIELKFGNKIKEFDLENFLIYDIKNFTSIISKETPALKINKKYDGNVIEFVNTKNNYKKEYLLTAGIKVINEYSIKNKYLLLTTSDISFMPILNDRGEVIANIQGFNTLPKEIYIKDSKLILLDYDNVINIFDLTIINKLKYNEKEYDEEVLNGFVNQFGDSKEKIIENFENMKDDDLLNYKNIYSLSFILTTEQVKNFFKLFTIKKEIIYPQLSLYIKNDNDWIMYTPEGLFTYGGNGKDLLKYHQNHGLYKEAKIIENDRLFEKFYRPDLIKKILAGEKIDIPMDVKSVILNIFPPELRILANKMLNDKDIDLTYQICDAGNGISDPKLVINGQAINPPTSRGFSVQNIDQNDKCKLYRSVHTLDPGNNVITFKAYDKDKNIANISEKLEVSANYITKNKSDNKLTSDSMSEEEIDDNYTNQVKPNLYFLSIALNDYEDNGLNLRYSIKDVNAVQSKFIDKSKNIFENIYTFNLEDKKVSKDSIEQTFDDISKKIKYNDTFVLYIAGHGITKEGKYQFLPYEKDKRVSIDELKQNLSKIYTNKSLVLLDTCQSGAAIENIDDEATKNRLAYDSSKVNYIVASSLNQVALEGYNDHGVFTYSVLDAFDNNPKLKVLGLANHVSELVPKITKEKFQYEQIPQSKLNKNFILKNIE